MPALSPDALADPRVDVDVAPAMARPFQEYRSTMIRGAVVRMLEFQRRGTVFVAAFSDRTVRMIDAAVRLPMPTTWLRIGEVAWCARAGSAAAVAITHALSRRRLYV